MGVLRDFRSDTVQARIDAVAKAGGGLVRVPAGMYHIEEPLRVRSSGIEIEGDGAANTIFVTYPPDRDALFVASDDGSHIRGFGLRGVGFRSATYPRTAGAYVRLLSVQTVTMERIIMDGPFHGFHLSNTTILDLTKFDIRSPQDDGIGILIDGEIDSNDHWIHHGIIRGDLNLKSRSAVEIRNSGFSILECIDGYQCGTGLILRADHYLPQMPNRAPVEHIWTRSCSWDTCMSEGMLIETHGGVSVRRIRSAGDWFASNYRHGVRIVGEHINGVDFIDAHSLLNLGSGFDIEDGINITLQNSKVAGNGYPQPGRFSGVRFGRGTARFKVENSVIGETEDIAPGAQGDGILIEPGLGGRYIIRNNDLTGNLRSSIKDRRHGPRIVRDNINWDLK